MSPYALLGIMVLLALARPLLYKKASMVLKHDSGPIFTSVWVLLGLIAISPFYGTLFFDGMHDMASEYWIAALLLLKGCVLWLLFFNGQVLTEQSLSAAKFVLPTALGAIAITNSVLGEVLTLKEWIAALGLCILGVSFAFRGHVQELGAQGRFLFLKLVCLSIIAATLDYIILSHINWYFLLFVTNFLMLFVALLRRPALTVWKDALFRKESIFAGSVFTVGELLKFYLMVSVLPMTVVISAQVAVIPMILILSALIWGERSWKEQLVWGILSVGLLLLLFL